MYLMTIAVLRPVRESGHLAWRRLEKRGERSSPPLAAAMLHPVFMWTNALSCRSEMKIYSGPAARSEAVQANKSWLGETAGASCRVQESDSVLLQVRDRMLTLTPSSADRVCYMLGCDLTLKDVCEHCKQSAWPQRSREWHYDLAGVLRRGMRGPGGAASAASESLCWEVLINMEEVSDTYDLWAGSRRCVGFVWCHIRMRGGSTSEAPWLGKRPQQQQQQQQKSPTRFYLIHLFCEK